MRPGFLRSGATAFDRISRVTAKQEESRPRTPERADVAASLRDDDWFELFADEKDLAPWAPKLISPEAIKPEPGGREAITKAAREAAPAIHPPELARIRPDTPPWLKYAMVRWHFGAWPIVAGALGILLSAGVLVFAVRTLAGDGRPAPAEIGLASGAAEPSPAPAEPQRAAPPMPDLVGDAPPASAPTDAPAPRTNSVGTTPAPPVRPVRTETRPGRVDPPARRAASQPPARRAGETVSTPAGRSVAFAAASSARPAPRLTPTPTPTPIPTPNAVPPPARIEAIPGPAPAPPPPAAPVRPSETAMVRSVLDLYRQAYSSLDANAVAGVWPSVNIRSLTRAFGQLESQRFEFLDCQIDLSGARAQATCTGRASFVPKIGGRVMRTENREWTFVLERLSDGWIISRADSR
jgi:hypothetical protein